MSERTVLALVLGMAVLALGQLLLWALLWERVVSCG